jgi:hypothetical protein
MPRFNDWTKKVSPVTKYPALIIEDKQLIVQAGRPTFSAWQQPLGMHVVFRYVLNLTLGMGRNIRVHAEWLDSYLESCVLHNGYFLRYNLVSSYASHRCVYALSAYFMFLQNWRDEYFIRCVTVYTSVCRSLTPWPYAPQSSLLCYLYSTELI